MKSLMAVLGFLVALGAIADSPRPNWTAAEKKICHQVEARVKEAVKRPHPRLFGDASDFARIKAAIATNELYAAAWRPVERKALSVLDQSPIERIIVGPRMSTSSSTICSRLQVLAMAYRLTGDRRFLTRAEAEMLNACTYEDWNPKHFLDTATTCLGLAIGYDWLYDDLAPESRARIRGGMERLGLAACEAGGSWLRRQSNWGQVCNAGAIAISLALIDDDRARAVTQLTKSISGIQPSMSVYAPQGAYPEGPGYWSYGTSFNAYAIALLESVLKDDFGLAGLPGFAETCSFIELATGPSGLTLNYSDGHDKRSSEVAIWWFAKRFRRPDLLVKTEMPRFRQRPDASALRLFWLQDVPEDAKVSLPLSWNSGGPNPFAVHRSGWDANAVFAAIKAGRPSYPHGHQDIGSFWLDAGGVRWVCDLGANNYHRAEEAIKELWNSKPESRRWRVFRLGVGAHSTLSFNGEDQAVGGTARIVSVSEGPESEIVVDMSENYPLAKRVLRKGRILPGGKRYRLSDQITGARAGTVIRWQFVTRAAVSEENGDIRLRQDGRTMLVRKKTKEPSSDWAILRDPKNAEWEDDNEGVSVVSFTVTVPRGGEVKIDVGFVLML